MTPVAKASYITAAGSENPEPDAAISGSPKNPVLPTALATIRAPARGRSMPHTRTAAHPRPSRIRWIAKPAIGTRISDASRCEVTRIRNTSAGSVRLTISRTNSGPSARLTMPTRRATSPTKMISRAPRAVSVRAVSRVSRPRAYSRARPRALCS